MVDEHFGIEFFKDRSKWGVPKKKELTEEDRLALLEHEAYLKYRSGEISRHEWSMILMHQFNPEAREPKLPWWKRIFKRRS